MDYEKLIDGEEGKNPYYGSPHEEYLAHIYKNWEPRKQPDDQAAIVLFFKTKEAKEYFDSFGEVEIIHVNGYVDFEDHLKRIGTDKEKEHISMRELDPYGDCRTL